MIPRSITVKGFLCYKDEQTIDLDGCDLWVLAGRNGSGKSAIFDAMTYALFRTHRGGKQDAASLIHTEADELSVCFEFGLGADRYRIHRSYRKGKADRCAYRFVPQPDGSERWPAVPETESDKGLERWVKANIGLDYETFTASVLLLQGRTESLLGAKPRARFEIIAGIVDLESYRRLHKLADARRQHKKARAESLRDQLEAMPVIEPAAIEQAVSQLDETEQARSVAEVEWKRLVNLQAQAVTWLDLVGRLEKAGAKREQARHLVADSAAIDRDCARLKALDAALPALRGAIERRRKIEGSEAEARRAEAKIRELSRRLDLVAALEEDNRRHLDSVVVEIERDGRRLAWILKRQADLATAMARARQARARATEVRKWESELASYPVDLADRAATLELDHRRSLDWKAALPSLENLVRERDGLAGARGRIAAARRKIEDRAAEVDRTTAELARRRTEEGAAREAEGGEHIRLIEAETRSQSAARRRAAFSGLRAEPRCDRCGQELTPEHFAAEEVRLRDEHEQAVEAADKARSAYRAAKHQLEAAGAAREEAEQEHSRAVSEFDLASRERDKAEEDADRHTRACRNAYDQLEDPLRLRVAPERPDNWLATAFPAPNDLAAGRALAREESSVRSRLEAVRKELDERKTAEDLLKQARQILISIGLQIGDEVAETEHESLQAEGEALDHCLAGHRVQKELAEATRDQLTEHCRRFQDDHQVALRGRDGALNLAAVQRQEQVRARAELDDESWRIAFDTATEPGLETWNKERELLRAARVEERAKELSGAHLRLKQAEEEVAKLDDELAALSPEARRHPEEVAADVLKVERRRDEADAACRQRQGDLVFLRKAREGRLAREEETRAADRDRAVAETLARLLGPRGLQRDLIREAERGIVAYANPILREISGGELELRLLDSGDDQPDHALQLEAIERVHGRTGARGVEYLSGSQKFRVAVSLALAIGQYARGSKERPIESVIIDEGFGSLDRQGRDEMIEQLNALRGRLTRILLVSHQEEFAEAFRDGYHFEVVEGSTVARPFHR